MYLYVVCLDLLKILLLSMAPQGPDREYQNCRQWVLRVAQHGKMFALTFEPYGQWSQAQALAVIQ